MEVSTALPFFFFFSFSWCHAKCTFSFYLVWRLPKNEREEWWTRVFFFLDLFYAHHVHALHYICICIKPSLHLRIWISTRYYNSLLWFFFTFIEKKKKLIHYFNRIGGKMQRRYVSIDRFFSFCCVLNEKDYGDRHALPFSEKKIEKSRTPHRRKEKHFCGTVVLWILFKRHGWKIESVLHSCLFFSFFFIFWITFYKVPPRGHF